jgi:DnaJ-class molecular chaperone
LVAIVDVVGKIIKEGETCPNCRAQFVVSSKKILEVHVEQGVFFISYLL